MKEIFRIKYAVVLIILIALVFNFVIKYDKKVFVPNLVIFGDNIDAKNTPFVQDDGIYLAYDTILKTIDKNIHYDKMSSKVIITTDKSLVKLKVNSKVGSFNLENKDIQNEVIKKDEVIYIPINILKEIYDIDITYNKDNNNIVIDYKNNTTGDIKINKVNVYSDITTDSSVIKVLNKNTSVIIYNKSFSHNRWYKIKTDDNIVGYIFKDSINNIKENNEVIKKEVKNNNIVLAWQYGNKVESIENNNTINVLSPTLYELTDASGNISSKDASEYVNKAKSLNYKVWPIITNGIDNANYSSKDTSNLVNSEKARENLIKNIKNVILRDNLDGINIDFEAMKTEDKDKYTQFIRELSPILRSMNKVISVDMYFVAYIDRKEVGIASDYVVLMGYDQRGAWSNSSGSISEIPWVDENVKSLIEDSNIPANKIILGVPFYTRLWKETSGISKPTTTTYTMKEQNKYISDNKLKPSYDDKAMQNYVEYTKGSVTYKMWLEDATSIKNRIDVINKYKLAGIATWRKGFETSDVWDVIKNNLKEE
ncbi:MAG: glycosyl hydrolase family 18 protein [Clostridia bacterium]